MPENSRAPQFNSLLILIVNCAIHVVQVQHPPVAKVLYDVLGAGAPPTTPPTVPDPNFSVA